MKIVDCIVFAHVCTHILSVEFNSVNINSTYTFTEDDLLKTGVTEKLGLGLGLLGAEAFRRLSSEPPKHMFLATALLILTGD